MGSRSPISCVWCGVVYACAMIPGGFRPRHSKRNLYPLGANKHQDRACRRNFAQIKRAPEIFADETMVARSLIQHAGTVGGVSYGGYDLHSGRTVVWADNI